ncbi:hypothetical protein GW750_02265 [bacterium]|nr:hypothetical protein [bacterium]
MTNQRDKRTKSTKSQTVLVRGKNVIVGQAIFFAFSRSGQSPTIYNFLPILLNKRIVISTSLIRYDILQTKI